MFAVYTQEPPLTRDEAYISCVCIEKALKLMKNDSEKIKFAQGALKKLSAYYKGIDETYEVPFG